MSRLQIHSISFFIGCGLLLLVLLGAGVVYAAGNPLEVYNDASYSGMWCYSVSAGPNNIASSCNDQVSSVALLSGWSVRLYRDANQSGPSRCFSASDANLTDNTYEDGSPMNDTASSFILYQQAGCPPLEVHNDANYTGSWCYSVGAGPANVASTCNDQVSSILLTPGWSMRVYRDANQGDPSRCFTASDPNLTDNTYEDGSAINDTVSSFNLYAQGSCPDITPPSGSITSPTDGITIIPGTVINIKANAWDNTGGSGINRVEFHVLYGGAWHPISTDSTAPYEAFWSSSTPQKVAFTIHVIDNAGSKTMDPGGYRWVIFSNAKTVPPPPPPPPSPDMWNVPYYWQGDPQWGKNPIGACNNNINNVGCALTSLAMIFQYYGANHNPGTLNSCLGTDACPLYWGSKKVSSCSSNKVAWVSWPTFSYSRLEQELKSRPVILDIGNSVHFVVVLSGSGNDPRNYIVNDPGVKNGVRMKLSETLAHHVGAAPFSMRLYSGTPAFMTAATQLATSLSPLVSPQPLAGEIITGTVVLYRNTETKMTLELAAQSTAGTITEMQVWTDQTANDVWQPFTSYVEIPLGREYYARFRDAAGNTSTVVKVSVPIATPDIQIDLSSIYLPFIIK